MRRIGVIAAVVGVLLAGGCGVDGAARALGDPTPGSTTAEPATAVPPTVGSNAVLRPTFTTTEGPINAGTAWVLAWPGGTYLLVTAHHLFGPAGGMTHDVAAADLPKVVTAVTATSADDPSVTLTSRQVLRIPGASAFRSGGSGKTVDLSPDLAAFRLTSAGGATALPLATTDAAVGDRVFLLAQVSGEDGRLFPATVSGVIPNGVQYTFDEPSLELRGTSGAPLLNARGEVIGTNLAGGDGVGLGNPAARIREHLRAALGGR